MKATHKTLQDGTVEVVITIPWADVKKEYEHVFEEIVKNTEIDGFRKGKAPRKLIEEKSDKGKVYEEVLKHIIPRAYNEAITAEGLKPVVNPKVELKEAVEEKDWTIIARTCERPKLTLGEYKKALKELHDSKKNKIWLPGEKPKEEDKKPQKATIDEIVRVLLTTITVALPPILIEQEVNRLLSDLIDQTKRLGLSVEQYLSSTGRTAETIRKEYEEQAKRTVTLELALEDIADKEGILISDDDIEAVLKTAKTEEERKSLASQRYYLASILRRQKTLDTLASF